MKKMLLLATVAALCSTASMAAKDHFNRTTLGSKWIVTAGSLYITSDQLQGTTGSLGYDKRSVSDTAAAAILYLTGTDLEYGAVAVGNVANGTNAFVKLQEDSADSMFDYGAFYTGNNGGGDFFQLNSEVPSPATLNVSICGTTAVMKIKSAAGTQKYSYDYGTSVGTGGGLGTYGNIALDNYKSGAATCKADLQGATRITHSTARDPSLSK